MRAVEEDSTSIVERIDAEIGRRSLLKHPFYRMWSEGALTVDHLRGYSKEYFQLVKAVPGMVDSIARSASSVGAEGQSVISESAREEAEHVEPWVKFANSLGVASEDLLSHVGGEKTVQAVEAMQKLAELPFEQAVAAMYAYESELPKISRSKIDGLQKFYEMTGGDSTRYFELHEEADVRHAQIWREILMGLPAEKHAAVFDTAAKSLDAQNMLLDSVQEKYVGASRC